MLEELKVGLGEYQAKWQTFIEAHKDITLFAELKPTAVAWKTEDLTDFIARFDELQAVCDQVHLGWVNERWLATMHLKDTSLPQGLTLVKLMQRRPGSSDATGLDHLDFLLPEAMDVKATLQDRPDVKWTEEFNGDKCKWISIWFDGTEAKLRSDTVLQVCADDMLELQKMIVSNS
jgi:hypothetical protein